MADLISRAAALEAAIDGADDWDGGYDPERERYIREHMAKVPTVDALRIVRCKDCMYFRPWRHDRGDDSRCEFWNTEMSAEDYCSQAIYLNNGRDDDATGGR